MKKNLEFLSKALSLLPEVKETLVPPKEGQFFSKPLGKGDSVTIDFGKHLVGHLQVKMGYVNSHHSKRGCIYCIRKRVGQDSKLCRTGR